MAQSIGGLFEQSETRRPYSARRSQLEIQMDVLRVVQEGAYLPTQIMYRANLAWVALQNCLASLVNAGLLERANVRGKRSYQLTFRGLNILATFRQILESVVIADVRA